MLNNKSSLKNVDFMARDTNPTLQNQIYIFSTAYDQDLTDTKTSILESDIIL